MTGITHRAILLLVVAAAGLADVQVAVQTLTFAIDQELEGLKTSYTVGLSQAGLVPQQLSLGVLLLNLCLQLPESTRSEILKSESTVQPVHCNTKRIKCLLL